MKKTWSVIRKILAFPFSLIGFIIALPALIVFAVSFLFGEIAITIEGHNKDMEEAKSLINTIREFLDLFEEDTRK